MKCKGQCEGAIGTLCRKCGHRSTLLDRLARRQRERKQDAPRRVAASTGKIDMRTREGRALKAARLASTGKIDMRTKAGRALKAKRASSRPVCTHAPEAVEDLRNAGWDVFESPTSKTVLARKRGWTVELQIA